MTADLTCAVNLFRRSEGRRLLLSAGVSLAFLAFVADMFGRLFAASPQIHEFGDDGDGLTALLGTMLLPGLLMTLWFGFGGGPRQLFELPQLELLLKSPVSASGILAATWLRFSAIVTLWCTVLCGPGAARLGPALGLDLGYGTAACASAVLVLPSMAILLCVQVVMQRFFAGRLSRLVLTVASTLGSIAFSLLLIFGALAQEEAVRSVFAIARGQALWPFLLDTPARLWAEFAGHELRIVTLARAIGIVVAAGLLVGGVGLWYRTAYENTRRAVEPLFRFGRGRRWPGTAAAVMFRKELAQLLQQPTQLVGLLFSAVVIVVLAGGRFLGSAMLDESRLSTGERAVFAMLALWLFAQLTIAPGCLLRIVVAEGPQWPLLIGAPIRTRSFLLGKLGPIALLQGWPALVAGVVGAVRLHADPTTLLVYAAIVPAGVLWTTSVTALVGTIPPLMRPGGERNNLLALIAVAVLLALLQATLIPGVVGWWFLLQRVYDEGPLAGLDPQTAHLALAVGAWGFALIGGGAALLAAAFQVRRLRRPER